MHRTLNGLFSQLFVAFLFLKTKINEKEAEDGPFLKTTTYFFKKMDQTWPLFVLFSFFSHDKYSTNTVNEKA